MSAYSEAEHRRATERLVRFAKRADVSMAIDDLAPWSRTELGGRVWRGLAYLADLRLGGEIDPAQYEAALCKISRTAGLPLTRLRIVARWALEFCRCSYFGGGNVPVLDVDEDEGRERPC